MTTLWERMKRLALQYDIKILWAAEPGPEAAYRRMLESSNPPCGCLVSTDIAGQISCGTGKLDDNGFWEFPCTHGKAAWLEQKLKEHSQ